MFPGTTGSLTIDPRDLSATVPDVTVPVASVSTRVTRLGATTAMVAGNLTLHG